MKNLFNEQESKTHYKLSEKDKIIAELQMQNEKQARIIDLFKQKMFIHPKKRKNQRKTAALKKG